jgi:hypothetical protein
MLWIDFPPIAEFEDRHGIVRAIRGTTILGRFEFADRMADIQSILDRSAPSLSWEDVYRNSARLQHAIDKALECWGIHPDWLTPSQIEQLLFFRGDDPGWLIELSKPKTTAVPADEDEEHTLADALAAISTHCQSLTEAIDLASRVPADLLLDTLAAKVQSTTPETKQQRKAKAYVRQNFDKLMETTARLGEEIEIG